VGMLQAAEIIQLEYREEAVNIAVEILEGLRGGVSASRRRRDLSLTRALSNLSCLQNYLTLVTR